MRDANTNIQMTFQQQFTMASLEQFVDSTSALAKECAITDFECRSVGCGKICRSADEGVNAFMKLCNACCIKLRADMEDKANEDMQAVSDEIVEPWIEETENCLQELQEPQEPDQELILSIALESDEYSATENVQAPNSNMTMDDISTSLRLLVQACDKRQSVVIKLGKLQTVLYLF